PTRQRQRWRDLSIARPAIGRDTEQCSLGARFAGKPRGGALGADRHAGGAPGWRAAGWTARLAVICQLVVGGAGPDPDRVLPPRGRHPARAGPPSATREPGRCANISTAADPTSWATTSTWWCWD